MRTKAIFKKFRLLDAPFLCVYCGELGQAFDHVSPASLHRVLSRFTEESITDDIRGALVLSCNDCNSALLGNCPEWLLSRRIKALKSRMLSKYNTKLNSYLWEDDEIDELGSNLRSHVRVENHKILTLRLRYAFQTPLEFIDEVEDFQLHMDRVCNQDALPHWDSIKGVDSHE